MKENLRILDQVQVAKPCPANWGEMKGNDQVRHCTHCRLNVYNLSEMSAAEAEKLVRTTEGRLCVRFYRREDGTMITRDCPKGVRAAREKLARVFFLTASCFLSAIGCGSVGERLKQDFLGSPKPAPATATPLMGDVAYPIPLAAPSKSKAPVTKSPTIELGEAPARKK